MRKYVIGIVIGFLLASALPVSAAVSSLIGKKVQGEYPVYLGNEKLPVNAIAIDGTTYAPLRATGNALGAEVSFQNKTVILTKTTTDSSREVEDVPSAETIDEDLRSKLIVLEGKIMNTKSQMYLTLQYLNKSPDDAALKQQYADLEKQLADLEAEKAALEAAP